MAHIGQTGDAASDRLGCISFGYTCWNIQEGTFQWEDADTYFWCIQVGLTGNTSETAMRGRSGYLTLVLSTTGSNISAVMWLGCVTYDVLGCEAGHKSLPLDTSTWLRVWVGHVSGMTLVIGGCLQLRWRGHDEGIVAEVGGGFLPGFLCYGLWLVELWLCWVQGWSKHDQTQHECHPVLRPKWTSRWFEGLSYFLMAFCWVVYFEFFFLRSLHCTCIHFKHTEIYNLRLLCPIIHKQTKLFPQ